MQGHEPDTLNRRDMSLLNRAITSGWDLKPEELGKWKARLLETMDACIANGKDREVIRCLELLAKIVGQRQADEHLALKYEMAKDGHAEGRTEIVVRYEDREPVDPEAP